MKTLKTLFSLLMLLMAWQGTQAQCATFTLMQPSNQSDTVYIYTSVLSADSLTGTATIDYGDGYTEQANNFNSHVYAATGQFAVCLNYTGSSCTGTYCDTIDVIKCTIAANMEVSQSTTGGVTTLNVSNVPAGSSYQWHLAAGATAPSTTVANPTVTYPPNGTYSDYVEITSVDGCTRYVGYQVNTLASCSANWNKSQYGNNLSVSAAVYHSGATYTWNFGDGQTATGPNQPHTFASFGTYNVCLKVQTAGCIDSICQNITTAAPACPSADSLFTATVGDNGVVQFVVGATDSIQLSGNTVMSIDYGDSNSGPFYYSHGRQYNASGSYTACVSFTNNYCNVTQCDTLDIDLCNISSSIGHTLQNAAVYYYLSNANPGWTYQWSFPGGTPATSTHPAELVSYATPGSYTASVTVSAPGCAGSSTYNTTVYASHDSCNANFSYTLYGSVIYVNPQDSMYLVNGEAIFDYGDGYTGTATNHTYAAAGSYYVSYVVNTAYCSDSIAQLITVTATSCDGDFTYYVVGNTIYAQGNGIGGTAQFIYDGFNTTDASYTFSSYGTYTVCHVASVGNCFDTVCKQVTIAAPHVTVEGNVYKAGAGAACEGTVFLITDSSGYLSLHATYTLVDSGGGCTGYYHFIVPAGTYYVKAALASTDADYASYMPTYYGDELNWADATPIAATGTNGPWDINMIAGVNPGGPGFIGGEVSQGAGLGVITNYEHRAVGDPLPNIQINLLTNNDVPVAYTYSDGSGMYAFNNIPLGSYKVYAEAISKTPITENVTLTANNPSANNVNVEVNTSNAVTSINDIAELKVDAVYPNPVKDVAMVRFTAKQNAEAKVQVTDVRGVVVYTSTTDIHTGSNELKINLANHAAGVYVVTITNSDNNKTIRLLKAN